MSILEKFGNFWEAHPLAVGIPIVLSIVGGMIVMLKGDGHNYP